MSLQTDTYQFVGAFVDELARNGLRNVCFAPGSRSTPLTWMLTQHEDIRMWVHLDERSAAFFALGMAKMLREPVAILCSSGTATANFLPGVIEAHYSRIPLLVLTADRPGELQDNGAPQTIDQNRLFGVHAKWFAQAPLAEATPDMLRYARTLAGRAWHTSVAQPAGPVHLNFPFREPLMPVAPEKSSILDDISSHGREDQRPYARGIQGPRTPAPADAMRIANTVQKAKRGLIVCGPQDNPALGAVAAELGRQLSYPVLADPLSLCRNGSWHGHVVLDAYDAFLRDPGIIDELEPDIIIRFGALPTSKPYMLYMNHYPDTEQIIIDGGDGWLDPTLLASEVIHADPTLFVERLLDDLPGVLDRDQHWLDRWVSINHITRRTLTQTITRNNMLFEGRVFTELANIVPAGTTIYAGNSMPVRDLDTFFPGDGRPMRFLSNRGANGIDGVISSALGASTASDGPTVLVIGDLSFYHDMNGLLAAKLHQLNATILLVNNNGGGIFSFLPQSQHPEHFESLFGTPHGIDFSAVAQLYDTGFIHTADWENFRNTLRESISAPGVQVIEIPTLNRTENVRQHRELWNAVSRAVHGVVNL